MIRPDETGGLGLTDTTAEHAMQAAGLALPRREPHFRRSRIYAEAESITNLFVTPRRNSISAVRQISQKPRASY